MDNDKISIKDIVQLALKGYSKDDIKELFDLAKSKESDNEAEQKTPDDSEGKDKAEPETQNDDPKDEAKEEKSIDIEALKKELEAVKGQLKEAQKANTGKDISDKGDNASDDEIIKSLVRDFM